ncbi:DUF5999 family protein [Streptomyces sp. NPDC051578]|uniref:DUF5999 family protein n=1 Tax=Streptomyces sp. NPDC051578 TaxID=3365662 RepID=UPI00378ABACC
MCQHRIPCPSADAADRDAARTVAHQPKQGWSLLGNGVVLPDGQVVQPHRAPRAGLSTGAGAGAR